MWFPFFLFSFPGLGAAAWERSSFFLTDSKHNTAATAVKFVSIKTDEKSPTADLIFLKKTQLKEQQQISGKILICFLSGKKSRLFYVSPPKKCLNML